MSEASAPPPRARGPSDELDLSALGATLWRKKWTVLRPTILVALGTLVFVQFITPRYQSESRVFIESRDNIYLRPDADKDTAPNAVDDEAVTSQVQIILSRDLAREVINKLKLGERPNSIRRSTAYRRSRPCSVCFGLVKDPLSMTAEERVLDSLLRSAHRYAGRQIARHQYRLLVPGSRACRARRQRHRRRLSGAAARSQAGAGARPRRNGSPAKSTPCGRRSKTSEAKVEDFRAKANLLVGNNNTTLSAQRSAMSTPSSPLRAR